MARIIVKLVDFDQEPIIEYAITERELVNIYQYVQAMQSHLTQGTWEEICEAGYYGASALIHEVVELRMLLRRDPYLLMRTEDEIKHFARQRQNRDAHCRGLEAEYRYLQNIIYRLYGIWLDVGALVRANTQRYGDWDDLFETNLPFYEPALEEIEEAERWVKRLRNRGGES
jgi:hypothetical protein